MTCKTMTKRVANTIVIAIDSKTLEMSRVGRRDTLSYFNCNFPFLDINLMYLKVSRTDAI